MRYVFCLFLLLFCADTLFAQGFGRIEELRETNTAYFHFARPGEATVQVSLWGTIPASGIYEVREGTDLDKLLTLAGGLPIQPRQRRESANITVRLYRGGGNQRSVIYEASLAEMIQETDRYPVLQDDDVIVVETVTHQRFNWRDALSIVSSVGSIVLLVDRLFFRGR